MHNIEFLNCCTFTVLSTFKVKDNMERHKLTDVDKAGFPINNDGAHVSILDKNGNCVLFINDYQLAKYPEGLRIVFNPLKALEVNQALDALINIITKDFDKHIASEISIDLTDQAKLDHKVYTEKPLIIPTVQMYFNRIEDWLNYLGNCYDVNFKVRFYVKFKNKTEQFLLPLRTNLNNHEINKSYLKYCKIWFKNMDTAIQLEQYAKNNSPKESDYNYSKKTEIEDEDSYPIMAKGRKKHKETYQIILPKLNEYKFDELEMVSEVDLKNLVKHIFENKLPYQIAYLDYLGFIKNFDKYCSTKSEAHKILAKILGTNERAIRGHMNVLNPNSEEDKTKYTSHLHKDNVEKHYLTLK